MVARTAFGTRSRRMSSNGIELFFERDYDKAKAKLLGLVAPSFGTAVAPPVPKTVGAKSVWKRAAAAAVRTNQTTKFTWGGMARNMNKLRLSAAAAASLKDDQSFWKVPELPGSKIREPREVAPRRPCTPPKKVGEFLRMLTEHAAPNSTSGPGALATLAVSSSGASGGVADRRKAARVARRFKNKRWHDILLLPNPAPEAETKAKPAPIELMDPENNKEYNERALQVLLDDEVSKAQTVAHSRKRLRALIDHPSFHEAAERVGVDPESLWPRDVHSFDKPRSAASGGVRIVSLKDVQDADRWEAFLKWDVARVKRLALVMVESRRLVRLRDGLIKLATERAIEAEYRAQVAASHGEQLPQATAPTKSAPELAVELPSAPYRFGSYESTGSSPASESSSIDDEFWPPDPEGDFAIERRIRDTVTASPLFRARLEHSMPRRLAGGNAARRQLIGLGFGGRRASDPFGLVEEMESVAEAAEADNGALSPTSEGASPKRGPT
ncbi:hypothetical protein FNF31_03184 [Cafeteria roenbergensis]|uniref:Uncharacterized protein n=1 Tax=Cafeteria roenbergensis TaxID=33653 RepID=A0A5A8E446_CAFRO|nr:hypothetical protein FNF31_03184 [Cafeteria roenbergensis]KAA0170691.1 hypothetical protein FNF28_01236 [Cafeteria roenbergensis]